MHILYRACKISDLAGPPRSWINQGLTNSRPNGSVNANFRTDGYATNGISTSYDPEVAFIYACLQSQNQSGIGVFAIAVDDDTAAQGDVPTQAAARNIAPASVTGKSVEAQREVVLLEAKRSSVLGYYSIRNDGGEYKLHVWTEVAGDAAVQRHANMMLTDGARAVKRRANNTFNDASLLNEVSRLMGH